MAHGSLSHFKATLARKAERNQKRQARSDRQSKFRTSGSKTEFNSTTLSESELKEIKADIRNKMKLEKKKQLKRILIVMAVLTSILLFSFFKFS
ncbi:hypothetical protein G3567_00230 [Psychroflexus sp. YR1-1]|uniref:Uncharacterized protein n=1 Tax=Psychroflexus aurantiacus TaxID=2709310 RepID=A0A6B3R1S3_9FLAO|nr:hypothetical protein [Psychroflexus aurantiacus]NEV92575.1 hypothetical protein [Psychroflexus aurantiacus]